MKKIADLTLEECQSLLRKVQSGLILADICDASDGISAIEEVFREAGLDTENRDDDE